MEILKQKRVENNYSFKYMAKELGISKTYYWQLEHNQRRISYEMAVKIAKIFNKKPDDIFYNEYIEKKEKE